MELGFLIINYKSSHVAKEDSGHEATRNKGLDLPRPKHAGELKIDRVIELLLEGSAI